MAIIAIGNSQCCPSLDSIQIHVNCIPKHLRHYRYTTAGKYCTMDYVLLSTISAHSNQHNISGHLWGYRKQRISRKKVKPNKCRAQSRVSRTWKRSTIHVVKAKQGTPYISFHIKDMWLELCTELFVLSSLPCFYAFCSSAIPTSRYIVNVYLVTLLMFFFSIFIQEEIVTWRFPARIHSKTNLPSSRGSSRCLYM